jgi:hypothetical protein
MKLRSIVTLAVGIGIGFALANKLREDDPEVVRGPQRSQSSGRLGVVQDQGRRMADQATVMSLDVIRKARGAIRERLADYQHEDDAAWN